MAQLEPLNLRITGNANGLSAELGKAQRDVDGFDANVSSKASGLAGLFSGLGGPIAAGATAAFAALTTGAIAAAAAINKVFDELDKIADKADVANKLAISFTELRGLEFSLGELTGLDEGTIDNALQKLLVGLDEARTKAAGPVKDALDRLGLDAGRLLQQGPVEALKQIAEQTRKLEDPTTQLGIAYDLFGKNASQIVNALRGGADAIEESYNFAAKWLGLTQAQVDAAAEASDEWARIGVIFEGLIQLGAAELAPLFKILLEDFRASADEIGGMTQAMREFVDALAVGLGLMKFLRAEIQAINQLAVGDIVGAAITIKEGAESTNVLLDRLKQERLATDSKSLQALNNQAPPEPPSSKNANTRFSERVSNEEYLLLEQQRIEAEKEERRHQERIAKFRDAERSLEALKRAVESQTVPIPVDL